jgi:putative hydrolase of HD superfamily
MINMQAEQLLRCLMELHSLSKIPRTGWILAGVTNPETVGEHSFETAIFAYVLAKHSNIPFNMEKAFLMALFHEVGEARITDLPRRSKDYIGKAKNPGERQAAIDILHGMSDEIVPLLDELHAKQSPEARLVEAAEELQIIFKAMVYAKENRGDMSEYMLDVKKYQSLGIDIAQILAKLVGEKLNGYLGQKPYWEVGYSKSASA